MEIKSKYILTDDEIVQKYNITDRELPLLDTVKKYNDQMFRFIMDLLI